MGGVAKLNRSRKGGRGPGPPNKLPGYILILLNVLASRKACQVDIEDGT